jgi:transcriptional regulator with XRE-family HTH domain
MEKGIFVEQLIRLMKEKGKTQYGLAKYLGTRTSTVNSWFKGTHNISTT